MTRAQAAAKASTEVASYRCEAKLGKDRCNRGAKHRVWHETIGPTGAKIRWQVASEGLRPRR